MWPLCILLNHLNDKTVAYICSISEVRLFRTVTKHNDQRQVEDDRGLSSHGL